MGSPMIRSRFVRTFALVLATTVALSCSDYSPTAPSVPIAAPTQAENGLIGDVSAGKADLGVAGSRAWDSAGVSSFRALSAPLLINSYALQDRVLRSPVTGQMLRGLRPLGLAGIGVLPGPLRKPLGMARPLLRPSDYARLRIGVCSRV